MIKKLNQPSLVIKPVVRRFTYFTVALSAFVCATFFAFPQVVLANACQSNVTAGNWSDSASWTGCGGTTPQTTDTVQILAGHTITINGSNRQIAGLQIDNTGTLANSGFTITDTGTGAGVNGFTINGTLSGTGTTTISGSGVTIDGSGSISATGTVTINNHATIAATADLALAGTVAISGAVTVTNNGTVTTTGAGGITGSVAGSTWTQGTNATLNFGGGTTTFLATGTLNASASGNTVNYNLSGAQTCKVVTYYHLSFAGSGTKTCAATTISGNLTVGGTAAWTTGTTALTVSGTTTVSGGTLALSGGTGSKIFVGLVTVSSGTLSGSATVNVFRGGITNSGGTIALTGTATFNTNAQALSGTMSFSVVTVTGVTVTNNGTVTITSTFSGTGGWTQGADTTVNLGGATTNAAAITTLTATASGNTVNYYRVGTQTCKVITYYNLSFSGTSAKTCAIATINGNLSLSGTATWTMTTAVAVAGNVTISGGTLTTGAVAFTVSGATTISSGTLSITSNTAAKTFVGLVTVNGGTLSGASTKGIFQGGITRTSGTVSITGTATFNTNDQSLNGTMSIATVSVTTVTVTNYGTLTISASLAGTGGMTNETTGTINYNVTTTAPAITTLTSSAIGSTFNYGGAAQTCKVIQYYHLSFSASGTKTCAITAAVLGNLTVTGTAAWTMTTAVTVNGNVTVSGGTLTTGAVVFVVTGTTTISSGTLSITSNTAAKTFVGLVTVSGGTLSGASTQGIFQGGITRTSGTVSITGTATFNTNDQVLSGTISISTVIITGMSVTNEGTLTIASSVSGTGELTQGSSSNLNLTGLSTIAVLTASASDNTVTYDSTTGGQTVKSATYRHLVISKTGQIATLGGDVIILGNLTISAGTLDTGSGLNYGITLAGDWSNSGTFTARSGTITLNGSSQQTLAGTMTGGSDFSTLIITNDSGADDPGCGTSFTPGVIFSAAATATTYTITTAAVRVQYNSGSTYTFTNINWNGQASGTNIFFRNSNLSTGTWALNVSGTQAAVSNVNVASSDASIGDIISANDGTNTNCSNNTNWAFGTLAVDIVDGSGSSVVSPAIVLSSLSVALTAQTSTGTLGISSEKIRISNTRTSATWTLTMAASSGASAVWNSTAADYDYNDPTAEANDGADADTVGGQLSIDPAGATITPQGGCSTTGLTLGSSSAFSEGVVDSITLLTAGSSADTGCYWDLTAIDVSQTVPAEQAVGSDYSINMVITVTAS